MYTTRCFYCGKNLIAERYLDIYDFDEERPPWAIPSLTFVDEYEVGFYGHIICKACSVKYSDDFSCHRVKIIGNDIVSLID